MISWHGKTFHITGPLWWESTSHWWIPIIKRTVMRSSDATALGHQYPQWWLNIYCIDRLHYYYSHLVAARGRGSRLHCVWVALDPNLQECEVKCNYHWDIVQNKYENPMMLLIWNLSSKNLFNIGIYRFIPRKYISLCISMYEKPSVPACMQLILPRPLTATRWL